jgi:MFS family permease
MADDYTEGTPAAQAELAAEPGHSPAAVIDATAAEPIGSEAGAAELAGMAPAAEPATLAPPARRARFGVLWKHADFMKFWTGETVSLFGTQITFLALPLTAILVLNATPQELGLIRFLENVPFLLFAMLVGAWVDRRRKRPVMIGANIVRACLVVLVPVLAITGGLRMPVLYAIAFGMGVGTVFFDVCWMSYVPNLVAKEQLVEANSKVSTSYSAADVAGPGLGGGLVQLFSAPKALLADAFSYVISIISLLSIKAEEPLPERSQRRHLLRDVKEGLGLVLGNRYVRATTAQGGLWNFCFVMSNTIFLLYAIREKHFSAGLVGLVLSVGAVGAILGSALASTISRRFPYGRMIMLATAFGTLPSFLIPAASGSRTAVIVIFMVAFFMLQYGLATANVLMITLRQAVTPRHMLARMTAASRTVLYTLGPVGGLVGGALGASIGLRTTLWVTAVGFAVSLVPIYLSPIPSLRELPAAPDQ